MTIQPNNYQVKLLSDDEAKGNYPYSSSKEGHKDKAAGFGEFIYKQVV